MWRLMLAILVVVGCGDKDNPLGPTDQGQLLATLVHVTAGPTYPLVEQLLPLP